MLSGANEKLKRAHPHHTQTLAFTTQAAIFSTDTDSEDVMDVEEATERLRKCTDTNSASSNVNRSESGGILHFSFRDKMLKSAELNHEENQQAQITNTSSTVSTRLYVRFYLV